MSNGKPLHSLIPVEDFKALLGVDDRDDRLTRFALVTATYTIEQHCRRRLLKAGCLDFLTFTGDCLLPLREYPVRRIVSVHTGQRLVLPALYYCVPDTDGVTDFPYDIYIDPKAKPSRGEKAIKVRYTAGYDSGRIPADLASACLELAAWNLSKVRGRHFGVKDAAVRGVQGTVMENSMPENVRVLLEPYRRRTI